MLSSLLLLSTTVTSAPADHKIIGASLFKNGYAVIMRESEFNGEELIIESPPSAALGTLWVSGSEGVEIDSVVMTRIETEISKPLGTLDAILKANVGKVLTINLKKKDDDDPATVVGKLLSAESQIIVVETSSGATKIHLKSDVIRISGTTGNLVYTTDSKSTKSVLRIRGTGPGKIFTVALQRGLTWAPSYLVDITDEKEMSLTSKATILNDNNDLDGIDVKLVTGFPHMRFLNDADPLTSGVSVDSFVNSLMSMGVAASPDMMQNMAGQRGSVFAGSRPGGFARSSDPIYLQGAKLEDLFFYTLKNVTLKSRERGYHVIFRENAEYGHVYTLNFGYTNWEGGANSIAGPYDVWHEIKFTNPSAFPFTTGPATTVKGGEVIGQDMLNYTSAGSEALLKITKALDVHAEILEEEVSRERGVIKDSNDRPLYDLVTGKATIEISNFKDATVDMVIEKLLAGEVIEVSADGKSTKQAKGLRAINPITVIEWEPTIESGKTWKATYSFKVYVRSNGLLP